jgi:hypothetical protein
MGSAGNAPRLRNQKRALLCAQLNLGLLQCSLNLSSQTGS